MEETSRRIQAATKSPILPPLEAENTSKNQPPLDVPVSTNNQTSARVMQDSQSTRRRVRPAKLNAYVTSPGALKGASSRKRNLATTHRSPARPLSTKKRQPSLSSKANTGAASSSSVQPNTVIIPPTNKKRKDFHRSPPPAP